MDAMEFVVEKQLKSLLLDEDPTKIELLHQKMMWNNWANGRQGMVMGAISGIDVASVAMKVNDDDSLIVQYIKEHTPENAVVFLTGIGKCYPILRSHKVLNNLHQAFVRCPVVMFFPGTYNEQELILFNEIKDDNYYRAFRLVK